MLKIVRCIFIRINISKINVILTHFKNQLQKKYFFMSSVAFFADLHKKIWTGFFNIKISTAGKIGVIRF